MRPRHGSKHCTSMLTVLLPLITASPTASYAADTGAAVPVLEQSALDSLKRMSDKLAAANTISFDVRDMRDIPSSGGHLLTFINNAEVEMERPNKLRVESSNGNSETLLVYNAGKLSVLDETANAYVSADKPGSLDEVMRFLAESHGIQLAFEDFLLADPNASFSNGLTNAYEVGNAIIDGDNTRHLAFAAKDLEYQLWLDTATDLPKLFAVTYLDSNRPPHFLVEFDDWKLDGKVDAEEFAFKAPRDASVIEFLPSQQ